MGSISIQLGVSVMGLKLLLKRPGYIHVSLKQAPTSRLQRVFDIFREITHNDLAAILKYVVTETEITPKLKIVIVSFISINDYIICCYNFMRQICVIFA